MTEQKMKTSDAKVVKNNIANGEGKIKTGKKQMEQPNIEKTEQTEKKTKLSSMGVLAYMEAGKIYNSTEIRDQFNLDKENGRGIVRAVMRKLEKQGQVEIVPQAHGKTVQYNYRKLPNA